MQNITCLVDTLGRTSGEGLGSKLEAFLMVFIKCLLEGLYNLLKAFRGLFEGL